MPSAPLATEVHTLKRRARCALWALLGCAGLGLGAALAAAPSPSVAVPPSPFALAQPPTLPTVAVADLPPPGPPPWTDEAPKLSRWIEQGFEAQQRNEVLLAAERYCAAARYGSTEAQYRLGRLFLARVDEPGRLEGRTLLAMAAQGGHGVGQALSLIHI